MVSICGDAYYLKTNNLAKEFFHENDTYHNLPGCYSVLMHKAWILGE